METRTARRGAAVVGAIVLGSILAGGAAGAQPLTEPVALSAASNFVTPEIVVQQGQGLTFTNLDISMHSLASVARDALGRRLFDSGLVGSRGSSRVAGVEHLAASAQGYAFVCEWHGTMKGTIRVLPTAVQ